MQNILRELVVYRQLLPLPEPDFPRRLVQPITDGNRCDFPFKNKCRGFGNYQFYPRRALQAPAIFSSHNHPAPAYRTYCFAIDLQRACTFPENYPVF